MKKAFVAAPFVPVNSKKSFRGAVKTTLVEGVTAGPKLPAVPHALPVFVTTPVLSIWRQSDPDPAAKPVAVIGPLTSSPPEVAGLSGVPDVPLDGNCVCVHPSKVDGDPLGKDEGAAVSKYPAGYNCAVTQAAVDASGVEIVSVDEVAKHIVFSPPEEVPT